MDVTSAQVSEIGPVDVVGDASGGVSLECRICHQMIEDFWDSKVDLDMIMQAAIDHFCGLNDSDDA